MTYLNYFSCLKLKRIRPISTRPPYLDLFVNNEGDTWCVEFRKENQSMEFYRWCKKKKGSILIECLIRVSFYFLPTPPPSPVRKWRILKSRFKFSFRSRLRISTWWKFEGGRKENRFSLATIIFSVSIVLGNRPWSPFLLILLLLLNLFCDKFWFYYWLSLLHWQGWKCLRLLYCHN